MSHHYDNKINVNSNIPVGLIGEPCETTCVVDNISTTCLIDSGSVVTTIQKEFYTQHLRNNYPLAQLVDALRIEGANGQPVLYEGYISVPVSLPKEIVGINTPVNVLAIIVTCPTSCPSPIVVGTNVFRGLTKACRAHIGPNFLSQIDVPPTVRVCYQKALYEEKMGNPITGKVGQVRCRLRRPVKLSPSQVIEVTCILHSTLPEGKHEVLIQELEGISGTSGIQVVNSIHEVNGRKAKVRISVSNNTNTPITLHNKQVIADAFTYMWSRPVSQVCANLQRIMTEEDGAYSPGPTVPCYFTSSPQKVSTEDEESLGDYDIAPNVPRDIADSLRQQLD